MKLSHRLPALLFILAALASLSFLQQTEPWAPKQLMNPADLAAIISNPKAEQPLVFSVGPAAVIKNSIDMGPAQEKANLQHFRKRLEKIDRAQEIVIYCGCCPFSKCPNIRPAFSLLNELKFTNHRLLNISNNVKTDWIDRGYPVAE